MNDFWIRLRMAMQQNGVNAAELSRISGVGKNLISYYLRGKYLPKQDKVYLLAKALNVDPGWLMTGVQPKIALSWFGEEDDPDQERLEALHQNPRLGTLFDRARKMKPEDIEYMLRFADGILKERDGDG